MPGPSERNPLGYGGCKPGETRNVSGRPKGVRYISELMREYMLLPQEQVQAIATDASRQCAERMAAMQVLLALNADEDCVDRVLDRTEGKPTQAVQLTGADEGPVKVDAFGQAALINSADYKAAYEDFIKKAKKT